MSTIGTTLAAMLGIVLAAGAARAQARDCLSGQEAPPGGGRVPFALVLDPTPHNRVEGMSLAPGRCRVTPTLQSFLAELQRLESAGIAVATLHIISHGAVGQGHLPDEGVLFFSQGSPRKVGLSTLAQEARKALPDGMNVNQISFRGCRIGGGSKASLDAFRSALGAVGASGTNCRTVVMTAGPMSIDGHDIRRWADLRNSEEQTLFNAEFADFLEEAFVERRGRSVSRCIVGLNAAENARDAAGKLAAIYFGNRGELAAVWTNACASSGAQCELFDPPASKCFVRLKSGSGTCRSVRVP